MGKLEARNARRTVTVGMVVLAVIGAALYLAATAHNGLPFAATTTVRAAFSDVHALKSGDEVRQNSTRIGRVDDIRFENDVAVVTLRLDGNRDVHRDARAAVWDMSALGTKFVELYPGTPEAGPLADRTIPERRTIESSDIYELLDVFDDGTRDAATSAARELGSGVAGLSRELHDYLRSTDDLLSDAGTVSRALSSDEADLPALLSSAHRLSARFAGREQQISDLLARTDTTLRAVSVDDGQALRETLRLLPATLDSARSGLDAIAEPLAKIESAATELRPGASALGESTNDLRGVLRDGVPPLRQVPPVATAAEPAVTDLTTMFADARPLAPMVARAFHDLATPLTVLAPYAPEIADFFVYGHSFVGEDINGINYARLGLAPGLRTGGSLVLDREQLPHNSYPAPGEARTDRAESSGGGPR